MNRTATIGLMALSLAFSAVGCGPMNDKPAQAPGSSNDSRRAAAADGTGPTSFSAKRVFLICLHLKENGAAEQPKTGDNRFSLRIARASDLSLLPKEATLTVSYLRTEAHVHRKFPAELERQEDGSYLTTLSFKKSGKWEVHVEITDGGTQDEFVALYSI